METSNQLYQFLTGLAGQLPSLLTMLGGIVLALVRWRRDPKVSMTLVIGLGLMLLHVIVFAVMYAGLHSMVDSGDWQRLQTIQTFVSIAYNFTLALLTAILLAAIFMQRTNTSGPEPLEYLAEARAA